MLLLGIKRLYMCQIDFNFNRSFKAADCASGTYIKWTSEKIGILTWRGLQQALRKSSSARITDLNSFCNQWASAHPMSLSDRANKSNISRTRPPTIRTHTSAGRVSDMSAVDLEPLPLDFWSTATCDRKTKWKLTC